MRKVRKVEKAVKAEVRESTFVDVGHLPGTTLVAELLNGFQTGDLDGYRAGSKIFVKSVTVKGCWVPGAAQVTDEFGRFMVVWDKRPNGSALTGGALLETALDINSMIYWPNKSRFKIIYDKTFPITPATKGSTFYFTKRINKFTVYTETGNPGISNLLQGALYVCFYSSAASNFPELQYNSRVIYNP